MATRLATTRRPCARQYAGEGGRTVAIVMAIVLNLTVAQLYGHITKLERSRSRSD